jgi:hypothetical protein
MKFGLRDLLIASVLLLLLVYLGSYLSLVEPGFSQFDDESSYRTGGQWESGFFWPLEQLDRRVRPGAWEVEKS